MCLVVVVQTDVALFYFVLVHKPADDIFDTNLLLVSLIANISWLCGLLIAANCDCMNLSMISQLYSPNVLSYRFRRFWGYSRWSDPQKITRVFNFRFLSWWAYLNMAVLSRLCCRGSPCISSVIAHICFFNRLQTIILPVDYNKYARKHAYVGYTSLCSF